MKFKTDQAREKRRRFQVDGGDGKSRLYICDDDFHWDALLRINGDFETDAEKLRYATAIAKVLSDNEDKIPYRPRKSNR